MNKRWIVEGSNTAKSDSIQKLKYKMNFNLNNLVRENIKRLLPYSSARDEFNGEASIFLDANENSLGSPLSKWYNRYPDPLQMKVKEKLAHIKAVPVDNIFLGNGSDECIDVIIRTFCEPGIDNILICPPTYGMYRVSADINNVEVKKANLTSDFQLSLPTIENAINDNTKIVFLCSPNNPTANSLQRTDVEAILNNFFGIVVVDEAYINFSRYKTFSASLNEYPNLIIMQTFSKAWGLAALRLGISIASKEIIRLMNKVKPPYNINSATQELALKAMDEIDQVNDMIRIIVEEREVLEKKLKELPIVEKVYPSDANFLLVKVKGASKVYNFLLSKGIVVRDRSSVELCEDCLRITIGTNEENRQLLHTIAQF